MKVKSCLVFLLFFAFFFSFCFSVNAEENLNPVDFSAVKFIDPGASPGEEKEVCLENFLTEPKKITFFVIGAFGCRWCMEELRSFKNIYPDYKDKINVVFIVVDGSLELLRKGVKMANLPFPLYGYCHEKHKGALLDFLSKVGFESRIPFTVVLKNGKIREICLSCLVGEEIKTMIEAISRD